MNQRMAFIVLLSFGCVCCTDGQTSLLKIQRLQPAFETRVEIENLEEILHAARYSAGFVLDGSTTDGERFVAWVGPTLESLKLWKSTNWKDARFSRTRFAARPDGTVALTAQIPAEGDSSLPDKTRLAVVDMDGNSWDADIDSDGIEAMAFLEKGRDIVVLDRTTDPDDGSWRYALHRWEPATGARFDTVGLPDNCPGLTERGVMIPGPGNDVYIPHFREMGVSRVASDGNIVWTWGGLAQGRSDGSILDMKRANDGSLWVAGVESVTVEFQGGIVLRWSSDGDVPRERGVGSSAYRVVPMESGDAIAFVAVDRDTSSPQRTIRYSPSLDVVWEAPESPNLDGTCQLWFGTADGIACLLSRACHDRPYDTCLELWEVGGELTQ